MRHRVAGLTLSRTSAHRQALFSNLVAALLTHESIRTTDAKAKETRRLAERTITWARRVGDILAKKPDRRSNEESARVVHAVRMARRVCRDRGAVVKLFDELAPRFLARRGGYTRIVKLGQRPGDAAPMSLLELIPDDSVPAAKASDSPETKGKGGKAAKAEAATSAKASAKGVKAGASKKSGDAGEKAAAKKPAKPAKK